MNKWLRYMLVAGLLGTVAACSQISGSAVTPDPLYAPVDPQTPPSPEAYRGGAIFQVDYATELFRDSRAYRVGDIITINLLERTDAQVNASTSTSKDDELNIAAPTLFGLPVTHDNDLIGQNTSEASRSFEGSGQSSQSNRLQGSITVTVSEVLSNGNLLIRGEKIVGINQGSEYIRISGIIRPLDIGPDNSVPSTKIANSRVSYGGGGPLQQANSAGWLSRFFNSALWPF